MFDIQITKYLKFDHDIKIMKKHYAEIKPLTIKWWQE